MCSRLSRIRASGFGSLSAFGHVGLRIYHEPPPAAAAELSPFMGIPALDCWTAFILGLVGSLHCAGMCGPLALALPAAGTPRRLTCWAASPTTRAHRHLLPAGGRVWPGRLDASCWRGFSAGSRIALGRGAAGSACSPRAAGRLAPGHGCCGPAQVRACPACCAAAPSRRWRRWAC